MKVVYQGHKHCELTHLDSAVNIHTDAPRDNHGLGQSFSPTDLTSISLGSCMLTVIAIQAEKEGLDLGGSYAEVEKEMNASPRRIGRIGVHLHLPSHLDLSWRERLENYAHTCPVKLSLNPEIKLNLVFSYDA